MSEFRQNLATKEWAIIAPERGKRPNQFREDRTEPREEPPEHDESCPFCPGNETHTPEALYRYPDGGPWQVRAVPNKFAAVRPENRPIRCADHTFLSAAGYGQAEVIIESPLHNATLATMPVDEVVQVLIAYRERYRDMMTDEDLNLITIFRNFGPRAGTSLVHPHSQMIATPIVPPHVRDPIREAMLHFDSYGTCVFCQILEGEMQNEVRIVAESEYFTAFCPFASHTPFELRIYPKEHTPSFVLFDDERLRDLGPLLRGVLRRLHVGLDTPNYNYVIRSAPVGDEDVRFYHTYFVIIPKITTPAGFEIGTGIYINTTTPEDCAEFLRDVQI